MRVTETTNTTKTTHMKILITGASSYVGARLFFDLSKIHETIGTYTQHQISQKFIHLDITDPNEVDAVISTHTPDIILHVAANPNPRWCEANPQEAQLLNIEGTRHIVQAANSHNAKVIDISSFAAICPINVYGRSKYESEQLTKTVTNGYTILRPSFVLGYSPNTVNDRSFNRLFKNLDEKTPAVYDTSWKFQPTYLGHLSKVILACVDRKIWNETIHVTVPEIKSRFDTARDILTPFGIDVQPVNDHDTTPLVKNTLEELKKFNLPQYTYNEMIKEIIDDIHHRDRYIL